MKIANIIAFILVILGGINWLFIGIFSLDLVTLVFGASTGILSRIVYILVGLSAIWLIISSCYSRRIAVVE